MSDYEDYQQILERQNSSSSKIFNNIKPFHVIIIAAILFVVNQIIKTNKDNTFLYVILGAVTLIFLFSTLKNGDASKVIPRGLAEKIALQDLKSEIRPNGSYQLGTQIFPTSYFKDQSIDSADGMKLFKYNIGFIIKKPNNSKNDILYQMNPFSGECKGIVDMPMGFDGQDVKDIQLVFPETSIKQESSNPSKKD